ncbi:MAG: hypothetical protein ACRBM6_29530 [Geminicoccales bacterium]
MMVFMTALTALAALTFLGVVAFALTKILAALDSIGGRGDSYLAKLRFGLRAIERETSHLPAAAPQINAGLNDVAGGLTAVDATLGDLHKALLAQER